MSGRPVLPSPIDVLKRWPRAVTMVSALVLGGDIKHSGDGRTLERGGKIDFERYGVDYSDEKSLRHAARRYDGEEIDPEFGLPQLAHEAWHAINRLEAWCRDRDWTVDDIIVMFQQFPDDEAEPDGPPARERVPNYDMYVGDVFSLEMANEHPLPDGYHWWVVAAHDVAEVRRDG